MEFNHLVKLTKNNDISDVLRTSIKLNYDDEIKEETIIKKRGTKSKITLKLPEINENNEFSELTLDNLKNNILTYSELIIGENLLKIE